MALSPDGCSCGPHSCPHLLIYWCLFVAVHDSFAVGRAGTDLCRLQLPGPVAAPAPAWSWHTSRWSGSRATAVPERRKPPCTMMAKIAQGSWGAARTVGAVAGRALGRALAGMGWGDAGAHRGDLVARASWEGSRWGSGCIPSAPDYLSVSPLGTRTGSEHGGRPGRPNWRPSQTVKRGERRGSAGGEHVGGDRHCTARHGPRCHPPWRPALHPACWCTHGEWDRGTRTWGFPVPLPAACPWFPPRNGEPRATGCSTLQFWPSGPLQRETEARKDLSSFQAMSQGQSLILQAPCSGDALHRAPTPWGTGMTPPPHSPAVGALCSAWQSRIRGSDMLISH